MGRIRELTELRWAAGGRRPHEQHDAAASRTSVFDGTNAFEADCLSRLPCYTDLVFFSEGRRR